MSYDLLFFERYPGRSVDRDAVRAAILETPHLALCEVIVSSDVDGPGSEELLEVLEDGEASRLAFAWFSLRRGRSPSVGSERSAREFLWHIWGRQAVAVALTRAEPLEASIRAALGVADRFGLRLHDPQSGRDVTYVAGTA